ncbi:DNA polymerase III subunit alpha [Enterococcus cecorum]|uniref:DNA polymerase III subunit alpha n=1 Tax=Enterococcus cecorum TaxID=44008 RepID=UPI001FABCEB4|nr:DNA polymerase III subunit alpha [Enterococcus cecorum]MCJ0553298.1 DNA polymerase III subunit alpha [Enterococcus cecorum]MCJ0557834.1 DNA polymerase III subunit alpha [Enterococcus cecorum]MCJ0562635.1 DNA polymerase III subunit alpha [Enterococcus cecorum]
MCYVPIYTNSAYTLMNSTVKVNEYIDLAQKMGYQRLGLIDEDTLSGALTFYQSCLKANIQPIIGLKFSYYSQRMKRNLPLIAIALNYQGFQSLMEISTKRKCEEVVHLAEIEHVQQLAWVVNFEHPLANPEMENTYRLDLMNEIKASLPKVYYGIQIYEKVDQDFLETFDLMPLALSKVNILYTEEAFALKVLQKVQRGEVLTSEEIQSAQHSQAYSLLSEESYQRYYQESVPSALEHLSHLCEQVQLEIPLHQSLLPQFPLAVDQKADEVLKELCEQQLQVFHLETNPTYQERLAYELSVIHNMGFDDYFLIVYDVMKYAHDQKIVTGAGRGSAAGSLVAYLLRITDVDPIKYQLLFERFLNPDRQTMPDIDLDIPDNRRQEVLRYVHQKYGHYQVVQIATFGTMAAKMVLRDVSRVFGLSQSESSHWSKAVPNALKITLAQAYQQSKDLRQLIERSKKNQLIYQVASILEGLPRHVSTHAAGVIISDIDLRSFIPLQLGSDELLLSQYTMNDVQATGLLKFDFLGLKNLSIIDDALKAMRHFPNTIRSQAEIPIDEAETMKIFQKADTTGVFQFESSGIRQVLKRVVPQNLEDLAAVNALFRPGPMQHIDEFVARRFKKQKVTYVDPRMKKILSNTYGIIVYQEQVMQIASEIAGFTLAQADILRRAISKKDKQEMDKYRQIFVQGAVSNGVQQASANQIYDYIESFGDYGFNRSHAFAYSKVAYQMAYLKVHYPAAFFTALMKSAQNDVTKLKEYAHQLKKYQVQLLGPDINQSQLETSMVQLHTIRIGLANIKGTRKDFLRQMVKERYENGAFKDFDDFLMRVYHQNSHWLKEEFLVPLIAVGCFDQLGGNRKLLMQQLSSKIQNFVISAGSLDLLETMTLSVDEQVAEYALEEKLALENQYLGMYLSGHPLDRYQSYFQQEKVREVAHLVANQRANILLYLTNIKEITTKKQEKMAFITGNDGTQEIEVTIFPTLFRKIRQNLQVNQCVLIKGKSQISNYSGQIQFLAEQMYFNEQIQNQLQQKTCYLRFENGFENESLMYQLQSVLEKHHGTVPVVIFDALNHQKRMIDEKFWIKESADLYAELRQLLGEENVVMK